MIQLQLNRSNFLDLFNYMRNFSLDAQDKVMDFLVQPEIHASSSVNWNCGLWS